MARSKWKGIFIDKNQLKKTNKFKKLSRSTSISDTMVNKYISIHSGKNFKKVFISKDKVGLRLGEFVFTRKNV